MAYSREADEGTRFEVELKHETSKAMLVEFEGEEMWIPRSQIKDEEYDSVEGEDFLVAIWIPKWLADEKGMM